MLNFSQSNRITNALGESMCQNNTGAGLAKLKFLPSMEIERFFVSLDWRGALITPFFYSQ